MNNISQVRLEQNIELNIKRLGINGEGIGYYKGQAIFVEGAIPKEVVNIEITDILKNYAKGKVVDIKRQSKKRIIPFCKFFDRCGGCQIQHIDYTEQLRIKRDILRQSLKRYTDLDVEKLEIKKTIGMDKNTNYRNKSQLPIKNSNFGLITGLFEMGTNKFVYIDECPVQNEKVNEVNTKILSILRKNNIKAHDTNNKQGILKYVVTRIAVSTNEIQVTLVLNKHHIIIKKAAKEIIKIKNVKSVNMSINDKKTERIFGDDVILLEGKETIVEHFDGLELGLSPKAFYQLNPTQTIRLYEEIKKAANLEGNEKVLDAYCGVGVIGMSLAKYAKEVIGVDINKSAIINAKASAKANNIENISFETTKVESLINDLHKTRKMPDVIVFDPPRTGLDDSIIDLLLRVKVKKIVYTSCNPSTLAKDLSKLSKKYDINYFQPIDMFPHTSHVECVVLMSRADK